jgi:DNA-directed RNA polymerase subunit M/transcription elongation factor TFIIS
MPIPGVSPLELPQALCPTCSSVLETQVVSAKNGTFQHLLYACGKCQYAFESRPAHLNGEFRSYKVFSEGAESTRPTEIHEG